MTPDRYGTVTGPGENQLAAPIQLRIRRPCIIYKCAKSPVRIPRRFLQFGILSNCDTSEMNILKRLGRPISPHTGEDTSARADSMDASITFSGHLSQPWNAFHAASETRQSQHKSLKEIEYEVENR